MNGILRSFGLILGMLVISGVSLAMDAKITSYKWDSASNFERRLDLSFDSTTLGLLLNPSNVTADTRVFSSDSTSAQHQNHSYVGIIDGDEDSWVRLSLTKASLEGVFSRGGDRFKVSTDQRGNISILPLAENHAGSNLISRLRNRAVQVDVPSKVTRIAKIGIVVDSQFNEKYDGAGIDKAISVINAVDGIYREEFGLGLKIHKLLDATDSNSDPFVYGAVTLEQMLRQFRDYRMSSDQFSDVSLVHLFTGNINSDAPVGLAWINTACRSDGYDVGISTPYRHEILLAAHEIAHNLGAQHDSDTQCALQRDRVMWPYISSNTSQHFSSCTRDAVIQSINNTNSCHAETIDLQVSLLKSGVSTINATVRNNDTLRANNSAVVSLEFPSNSIATALEGDCDQPDDYLQCEVGTLLPGAVETIVVQLAQVDRLDAVVNAIVNTEQSADPHPENNRMSMEIYSGLVSNNNVDSESEIGPGGNSGRSGGVGVFSILPTIFLTLSIIGVKRSLNL